MSRPHLLCLLIIYEIPGRHEASVQRFGNWPGEIEMHSGDGLEAARLHEHYPGLVNVGLPPDDGKH